MTPDFGGIRGFENWVGRYLEAAGSILFSSIQGNL